MLLNKQGDTMKRKLYISLLILMLSAITIHIADADTHSELSNIFTLDTREEERIPMTHSALSNIFTLDTREVPSEIGLSHSALSSIFMLDTYDVALKDVNNDGKIDISDLVLVGSHFGESNPEVGDVNADGTVDIRDMALIGLHFGGSVSGGRNRLLNER
jgi:hypothetical protein